MSNFFEDVFDSFFGNPSQAWDRFKHGRTNEINQEIAEENLEYQKERNAIEDARYEEETAYNRAFAEDQRDYERALQQQIFEREDTALERQANQLSKLGINPLSQQLNGLGAGQAIPATIAPSSSSRGGSALHNDFSMSDDGLMTAISPIMELANSMQNINTKGVQRDKLREEKNFQILKNQEQQIINERLANKLDKEQEGLEEEVRHKKESNPDVERDIKSTANRKEREDIFQRDYGALDNSPSVVRIATETAYQADRALKYTQNKVDDVSKSATKSLADKASKAIEKYNQAMKKADDWIGDKWNKTKNWFKKHTASPDEVRNMYGY